MVQHGDHETTNYERKKLKSADDARTKKCWKKLKYFGHLQHTAAEVPYGIFTVKIATDLACAQRRFPCNTSGFRRQCYSSPQGTHLPINANLCWFSVSFAKLRRSSPV